MAHLLSSRLLDEACTADDLATVTERPMACARKWEKLCEGHERRRPYILNLFRNSCVSFPIVVIWTLHSLVHRYIVGNVHHFGSMPMSPRCIKQVDASQASKYRPIRIMPAMCRLFDRILADGINYFLYQNRLISATQCAVSSGSGDDKKTSQ